MRKSFLVIFVLLSLVILLITVALTHGGTRRAMPMLKTQTSAPTQLFQVPSTPIETWKTYRNEKYGFEFKYPSSLRIEDSTRKGIPETDILLYLIKDSDDHNSDVGFSIARNYSWNSRDVKSVLDDNLLSMGASSNSTLELGKLGRA